MPGGMGMGGSPGAFGSQNPTYGGNVPGGIGVGQSVNAPGFGMNRGTNVSPTSGVQTGANYNIAGMPIGYGTGVNFGGLPGLSGLNQAMGVGGGGIPGMGGGGGGGGGVPGMGAGGIPGMGGGGGGVPGMGGGGIPGMGGPLGVSSGFGMPGMGISQGFGLGRKRRHVLNYSLWRL